MIELTKYKPIIHIALNDEMIARRISLQNIPNVGDYLSIGDKGGTVSHVNHTLSITKHKEQTQVTVIYLDE